MNTKPYEQTLKEMAALASKELDHDLQELIVETQFVKTDQFHSVVEYAVSIQLLRNMKKPKEQNISELPQVTILSQKKKK